MSLWISVRVRAVLSALLCSGLWCRNAPNSPDFLQNAPEIWRGRDAQSSIRVQEGEPPSFLNHRAFQIIGKPEKPKAPKQR